MCSLYLYFVLLFVSKLNTNLKYVKQIDCMLWVQIFEINYNYYRFGEKEKVILFEECYPFCQNNIDHFYLKRKSTIFFYVKIKV